MTPPHELPSERSPSIVDALATIAEAIPDFLWMSTADGTPVYQNAAWQRYTGLTAEAFAQTGWEVLPHPDDIARMQAVWTEANATHEPFELEYRCRRHDGAYRWFLCRTVPVLDGHGALAYWVGMLTDVHEKKVLEAELAQSIRHRDEFLAALSHEIRNPLQALRQAHYVVQSPRVADDVRTRMHDVIERQLTLLSRFTDGFLDFNTVRWNTMALVPADITLGALVDGVIDAMGTTMHERSLTFDVQVDTPECQLSVDPLRVTQALTKVLDNAAKYSERGSRVVLRARCDQGFAEFAVIDWGCGIDPQRLCEIFELFARAPEVRGPMHEGFGIGLAMARHIAVLHGGTIQAHSDGPGRGSRFTLRLPLVAPPRS